MRLLPHGAKIGNATVIVDIISKNNPEIRPGGFMNPTYITDHDTGNAGRGADAEMHNRYIHNMASYHPRDTSHVSWHLSVDEDFIYQHIPFDEPAYHCGDGFGILSGNRTSIGVEKCMNVDGDRKTTEENAIALHVYLLKNVIKRKPSNVVPHQFWSGKYCPAVILRRDGSFNPFRKRIQNAFSGTTSTYKPPKKQTGSSTTTKSTTNTSIVDYLNKQGMNSSFSNRKKLADQYGIKNYKGTASQNIELLNKLKAGKPTPKPAAKPKTSNYKGDSIVDYLNRINVDSSFSNRSKLAKQYGIRNYRGTAAQNTQLLNKMRGKGLVAPSKSISQMADEVIAGKHGQGHAKRRNSLGISQSQYEKVRAEVNRRL